MVGFSRLYANLSTCDRVLSNWKESLSNLSFSIRVCLSTKNGFLYNADSSRSLNLNSCISSVFLYLLKPSVPPWNRFGTINFAFFFNHLFHWISIFWCHHDVLMWLCLCISNNLFSQGLQFDSVTFIRIVTLKKKKAILKCIIYWLILLLIFRYWV